MSSWIGEYRVSDRVPIGFLLGVGLRVSLVRVGVLSLGNVDKLAGSCVLC